MRIGLVIGGFGRGGSERQLAMLASGLAERGHEVEIGIYGHSLPSDDYLDNPRVKARALGGGSKRSKLRVTRSWAREFNPDVLHGFMKRASLVALLSGLPRKRFKVVASDFSTATYSKRNPVLWAALGAFAFADRVATQTEMNRKSLEVLAPWLRGKVVVVRNGVDTSRFRPASRASGDGVFRFVSVGTVYRVKNPLRVVEAAAILREATSRPFVVEWHGRLGPQGSSAPSPEYIQSVELIRRLHLDGIVNFHGENPLIEEAYRSADAVLHVSVQEGIPNAVVEGMATGLPVIVSGVSDLPMIADHARNGFVVDELNPASIAGAMKAMMELDDASRHQMGVRSRETAELWFGVRRFVEEYEGLYRGLVAGS